MSSVILTKEEQELFDKYKPLFEEQRFNLRVSDLGGSSTLNHWSIEDDIRPNIISHRLSKVFESNKFEDFRLWLDFYLDFVTTIRFLEHLPLCKKVDWDIRYLDYTTSKYELVAMFAAEDTDFYEIIGTFTFKVGLSSVIGTVVATYLSGSDIQVTLLDGTPLKIESGALSNVHSELTKPVNTPKEKLNNVVVQAIENLKSTTKTYIKNFD